MEEETVGRRRGVYVECEGECSVERGRNMGKEVRERRKIGCKGRKEEVMEGEKKGGERLKGGNNDMKEERRNQGRKERREEVMKGQKKGGEGLKGGKN